MQSRQRAREGGATAHAADGQRDARGAVTGSHIRARAARAEVHSLTPQIANAHGGGVR
jgi:hypothetical protein